MAAFIPLSRRDDPSWEQPVEGIPDYLLEPVLAWIDQFLAYPRGGYRGDVMRAVQAAVRITPPLDWLDASRARRSLRDRVATDPDLGLDILDYFLQHTSEARRHASLDHILRQGGSVWEVSSKEDGRAQLTRRVLEPIPEAIERVRADSNRAHQHLRLCWAALVGRHPNPSTAYAEAVKAVEAAAIPVIAPSDTTATLGKLIGEMRSNPARWRYVLNEGDVTPLLVMCQAIWRSQLDRHGTPDPSVPLRVSQEQADAAFHIALTLVRAFTGGFVVPAR